MSENIRTKRDEDLLVVLNREVGELKVLVTEINEHAKENIKSINNIEQNIGKIEAHINKLNEEHGVLVVRMDELEEKERKREEWQNEWDISWKHFKTTLKLTVSVVGFVVTILTLLNLWNLVAGRLLP